MKEKLKEKILKLCSRGYYMPRAVIVKMCGHSLDFTAKVINELVDEGVLESEYFKLDMRKGPSMIAYRSIK